MKKSILILFQVILLCSFVKISSQSSLTNFQRTTPNGILDTVYDQYGKRYPLANLRLNSPIPPVSDASQNSVPTYTCFNAGYFNLYFAGGSCFDGTSTAAYNKRVILCQLFTDISNFISSPLSNNSVRINMYCSDTPTNAPNTLGTAGAFFIFPSSPSNPNQGIVQNQIQKTLISGNDAYSNLPITIFGGANNFYHGLVNANPATFWDYSINSSTINPVAFDFYTIMLHEVTHALGFGSLIDANGFSKFGPNNNYFSSYDQFLKNSTGSPLLAGPSTGCPTSSLTFQGSTSILSPNCTSTTPLGVSNCNTAIKYSSSAVTVTVYTPGCYSSGSSLSHFEDYCTTPLGYGNTCSTTANPANSFNDLYYVMGDGLGSSSGSCYVKRFLKPEERLVLCDLGYAVKSTFSCSASGAVIDGSNNYHNYSGGACSGLNVWGQNDGIVNGVYTFTAQSSFTNGINIPISTSITANDATVTTQISCIEVIYNNATASIVGSSLVVVTAPGFSGLVLIKYLPKSSTQTGNPTFIYVYFLPGNCNPPNSCEIVQNGDMESTNTTGAGCGQLGSTINNAALSCWDAAGNNGGAPEVYRRPCTSANPPCNLGVQTHSSVPPVDSRAPFLNNAILGCGGTNAQAQIAKNNLSTPLIPGQTYQVSFWATNPPYPQMQSINGPVVLTLATNSIFAFAPITQIYPAGFTVISEVVVPLSAQWAQHTSTFVFAPTNSMNATALLVGVNPIQTFSINPGAIGNELYYCFIDDISIIPYPSPAPVFNIPGATNCGNSNPTFTNLAQYATIPGVFSGSFVTSVTSGSVTQYHFNAAHTSLSSGIYPIAFTYTNNSNCSVTLYQNVAISPTFGILVNSTPYCTNTNIGGSLHASTTSTSFATYVWEPGTLYGPVQTVSPSVNSTYTVTANVGGCFTSQTLAIRVSSTCCTNTNLPSLGSILSSNSYTGSYVCNGDITIPSTYFSTLMGEFLFSPDAKLIIENGGHLYIQNSHLYACSNTMWQGIVVKDGGSFASDPHNLIEDAKIAVDASNQFTSSVTGILNLNGTTFNKNFIDVKITNYTLSPFTPPFNFENCVFTCRALPFGPTLWPKTGSTSNLSTVGADLRFAFFTPAGLNPPYLGQNGFTVTTLKTPYAGQTSSIAILVTNVGVTTYTSSNYNGAQFKGITIGNGVTAANFNVFDSHTNFIYSINSNVYSYNNVFQNSRSSTVNPNLVEGSAIYSEVIDPPVPGPFAPPFNNILSLHPNGSGPANRFYDCLVGVNAINTFSINQYFATVRSTQSTSNPINSPSYAGYMGFRAKTNRFAQYNLQNVEFSNINNPVNITIEPGFYSVNGSSATTGVLAGDIIITSCYFGANLTPTTSIGLTYMNKAVEIFSQGGPTWNFFGGTGIYVGQNTIDRAFNGVSFYGIKTSKNSIASNSIKLIDENILFNNQRAIAMAYSYSTSAVSNTLLVLPTQTTFTNTRVNLLRAGFNTAPTVRCNTLKDAHRGFVFENTNPGTFWRGNTMENHKEGMVLTNIAIINDQGSTGNPSDNKWLGSAWGGVNYGVYTETFSNAASSKLYVKTGYSPPNIGAAFSAFGYGVSGNLTITTGSYICGSYDGTGGGWTGYPKNIRGPKLNDFPSSDSYYSAANSMFRFLHNSDNDSIRENITELHDFYYSILGTSIETFYNIESDISNGNISSASSLLSSVSQTNTIEINYKSFYSLYISYLNNSKSLSSSDSASLFTLAHLCPGDNGECIYQARALYNALYPGLGNYTDVCDETGSRLANIDSNIKSNKASNQELLDVEIFPNPATNQITITSNSGFEVSKITIKDVSGRTVLTQNIKSNGFIANLDLNLINGIYFVTLYNSSNDKVSKKLVIAR